MSGLKTTSFFVPYFTCSREVCWTLLCQENNAKIFLLVFYLPLKDFELLSS